MTNNYSTATVSPELPASLFSEPEIESLTFACGITCERIGDLLYFVAEDSFFEEGEDEDENQINCTALFQAKLNLLDPLSFPHIVIEGAATCSKMRQGEFGGFAYFISRDEVKFMSTWQWLIETEIALKKGAAV